MPRTRVTEEAAIDAQRGALATSRRYDTDLKRGAWLSTLGFVGKVVQPVVFLGVTWVFGPSTTGVFLLVTFLADMFRGAVVDGYADAVTVVGSWGMGQDDDGAADSERGEAGLARFRATTAAAIRATGLASLVSIPFAFFVAPWLGRTLFAAHEGFADALWLTALGMPFIAFATIALAATRALLQIHYQVVLLSFGRPIGMVVSAVAAGAMGAGLSGLLIGVLVVDALIAVAAAAALAHEIDGMKMVAAILRAPTPGRLHSLAITQSVNLTLNRYLTRIDALMLGAMGLSSSAVAFYGTGALITGSLREAKLVFTGALAPIVARHHGAGEVDAISALLGRINRWTGTIILPLVLGILVLRTDLVRLIDSSYMGDTRFIVALLIPPYLVASTGLAGNCVFYTGHGRWNLANSIAVAALNTAANLLLIPRYGLLGAAVATGFASCVVALAELVELRALERIVIPWRDIRFTQFGFGAALVPLVFLGDPANIGTLATRIVIGVGLVAIFFAVAATFGHPELRVRRARE